MMSIVSAFVLMFVILVGAVLVWLSVRLVAEPWWPTLMFQLPYRGSLTSTSLLAVVVGLSLPCALFSQIKVTLAALVVLFVVIGPMLTCRLSAWRAWRQDKPELREQAAAVRNRRNERMDVATRVSLDKSWPNYIIDAERARRRAEYQPPG